MATCYNVNVVAGAVTTEPKGEISSYKPWDNTSALVSKILSMEIHSYITGFVDGEGCFSVSFSKRSKLNTGIEVRPSFSVSQHRRNKKIVLYLHSFFKCGGVRYSASDQNYKFEVRSLDDLVKIIIPHFEKYPLKTSKRTDFEAFREICLLMKRNQHRNLTGLKKIIQLSSKMNEAGKRNYSPQYLLSIIDKMKV